MIVAALLALLPLVFLLGSSDPFEPTKVALLLTGAALLAAAGIHRFLAKLVSEGPGSFARSRLRDAATLIRREPLTVAMTAFLLSAALSTVTSPRPLLSLFGESGRPAGLLVAIAMTILFATSRAASGTPGWLLRVATAASAASGVAALYAVVQWAGLDPIDWSGAATFDGRLRIPSTLGHPNLLGAYLAMTLPLTLLLLVRGRTAAAKAVWAVVAGLSLAVVAATLSRGAWLAAGGAGIAAGLVLLAGWKAAASEPRPSAPERAREPRPNRVARLAGASLVGLFLFSLPLWTPLGDGFRTRIRQIADLRAPTSHSRLLLWEAGARMAADHPVAGVGTDAFGAHFPRYRTPAFWEFEWGGAPLKAHNELVQIAATQGGIGLAAALAVLLFGGAALARLARLAVRKAAAEIGRAEIAAAAGLLAAWCISSATGFSVAATGSLAAVVGGWLAGRARGLPPPAAVPVEPLRASIALLAATLFWLPLVATPWRGETAASRAMARSLDDPERSALLRRAVALAPWRDRYAAELGRTHLVLAFDAPSPREEWRHLGWARGGFERAVGVAPENAQHRAFLARVLAAQAAAIATPAAARLASAALTDAYGADSVSANVLMILAEGHAALGSLGEAHRLATRCARLYPDYAVPLADLGLFALASGRAADAADTLALALRRRWRDSPEMEASTRQALERARAEAARQEPAASRPGAAAIRP